MRLAAPTVVADRYESLTGELRRRLTPDVTLSHPQTVGYVHRAEGDTHLYFLSNLSDDACDLTAVFRDQTAPARAWSVNTAAPMPLTGAGEQKSLRLEAHESAVVVFSPDLADAPTDQPPIAPTHTVALTDWTLTVEGMNYPMAGQPVSWETIPALRHFSGTGTYTCTFDATAEMAESGAITLRLSHISAAVCVKLNGELVGDIWTHPLSVSLAGKLKAGRNTLCIEAYSTLINEMMTDGSYEPCPEQLSEWPYYGAVINIQRKARLNCMREFTEQKEPIPSGVWGEVLLLW